MHLATERLPSFLKTNLCSTKHLITCSEDISNPSSVKKKSQKKMKKLGSDLISSSTDLSNESDDKSSSYIRGRKETKCSFCIMKESEKMFHKRPLSRSRSFPSKPKKPTPPTPPIRSPSTRKSFIEKANSNDIVSCHSSNCFSNSVIRQSSPLSYQPMPDDLKREILTNTDGKEKKECDLDSDDMEISLPCKTNNFQNINMIPLPTNSFMTTPLFYMPSIGETDKGNVSLQPVHLLTFQPIPISGNQFYNTTDYIPFNPINTSQSKNKSSDSNLFFTKQSSNND